MKKNTSEFSRHRMLDAQFKDRDGVYHRGAALVDRSGNHSEIPMTIFGQVSTAEPTPVVQVQFPYNINDEIIETRNNGGTSIVENNLAKLSTGAVANQSANILTRVPLKYNPGQDVEEVLTAIFTTGKTGSIQWAGIGDQGDGFFFGFNGIDFAFLHRRGGIPEVRRLVISAGSTDNEDITITLDGDAVTDVTVTSTGNVTLTANEIAAHDFSNVGRGWEVHSMGSNVFFNSYGAGAKTGTYSIAGNSADGTFSQSLVGVAVTDSVTKQTAWSHDRFLQDTDPDNSPSGITLVPTTGVPFRIRFGWLGFDGATLEIKHPKTLQWVLAHVFEYSNANTVPSLNNPTLPLCAIVENTTNDTDMVLQIGSMGGFIGGRNAVRGLPHSINVDKAGVTVTETPIFSIHSHDIYQSKVNRVRVKPTIFNVSIEGNKPAIVRIRKNATLTGASFSPHDSNTSTVHQDVAATAVSGGEVVFTEGLAKSDSIDIDLEKLGIDMVAPEFLTLSIQATSASTTDTISAGNWQEQF